jgi:Calcineurin-like phosphoesterase superfamily domain
VRIGILSDIHEAVELLEVAIGRLTSEGVDRLLVLGDVFETGARLDETVRVLESAGAIGVYGNHDYGLCVDSSPYVHDRFSRPSLAYMGSLLPRMELDGCFFAHREPWLDCSDLCQIWHVHDEDLPAETIAKSFVAEPDRPTFIGHYHRWAAFTEEGPSPWMPPDPLAIPDRGPILVVVAAVCDGHAAILDTGNRVLTPVDLYLGRPRPEGRPIPRLIYD